MTDARDRAADALRMRRASAYENSRPDVQALVPLEATRILDLGCSSGALGAALKARQDAEVVGVEMDQMYASAARERLNRVVEADLEELFSASGSSDLGRFDCLIAADVLEHLVDPWTLLCRAGAVLDQGASAVISLPNVQHWETLFQVGIRGTWPRRPEGIFDGTHLRWFTLQDAYALLRQAQLEPVAVSRRYRLKPADWQTERQGRWFSRTPLRPFLVYQYVIRAIRRGPS
jgi:2-polyprenyl-3-methyl-5-hydroxy-6-metoxy-1,4-benzoquinol methylase